MTLDKETRPDFIIDDQKGNLIILEHFGMEDEIYLAKKELKEKVIKNFVLKNLASTLLVPTKMIFII